MTSIGDLFTPRPHSWGLRGDPYLWDDLSRVFNPVPLPQNVETLRSMLEAAFLTLTARPFQTTSGPLSVERYAHGGMSSGGISPEFWQDKGFPLILERFVAQFHTKKSKTVMKTYKLSAPDGSIYESEIPGQLGGYKPQRIYGRLDCRSALSHLNKGNYAAHRVFFADEDTAIASGFRPCAKCLPERYAKWKAGGVCGSENYPWLIQYKVSKRSS
jgi:hypothetical protein